MRRIVNWISEHKIIYGAIGGLICFLLLARFAFPEQGFTDRAILIKVPPSFSCADWPEIKCHINDPVHPLCKALAWIEGEDRAVMAVLRSKGVEAVQVGSAMPVNDSVVCSGKEGP